MTWTVARIHYHDDSGRSDLLLDCVGPVARSLALDGTIGAWYFQRHWLRGPHVRLYCRLDDPARLPSLEAAVKAAVTAFVARRPSRAALVEDDLRAAHELLADLELQEGPLFPLAPDNSVEVGPDDVDAGAYGGPVGLATARAFLCRSSGMVLWRLPAWRRERPTMAADLMALMVLVARYLKDVEGIESSYMSYRSHAEAFLNTFDADGRIRAAFDRRYRAQAEAMRRLVAPYLAPGRIPVTEATQGWLDLIEDVYPRIVAGVSTGAIDPPGQYEGRAAAIGRTRIYGGDRTPSPLHQLAGRNPTTAAYLGTPGHQARRFLVNLMYQAVLQAGLSPMQKFLACHMVANGIEELTGRSWRDVFATGAADA